MKTLILGVGNEILGDDGAGCYVAEELAKTVSSENVDIKTVNLDGLALLEHMLGYQKLIVIDAIVTEKTKTGQVFRMRLCDLQENQGQPTLSHHMNLTTAIELGRRLFPDEMPREVVIFAIGIQEINEITLEMTVEVKEAAKKAVSLILAELAASYEKAPACCH